MTDEKPMVKIEIDPPYQLEDSIVSEAARQLLDQVDLVPVLRERVERLIDMRLVGLMDKAFAQIVQPTDAFGKPNAPPVSMQEFMLDRAEGYLDQRVNQEGKPVDACSYGDKRTRGEWLAERAASRVWTTKLERTLKEKIDEIRDELQDRAIKVYATKLKRFFDQAG